MCPSAFSVGEGRIPTLDRPASVNADSGTHVGQNRAVEEDGLSSVDL
jgi:hypothetical protein